MTKCSKKNTFVRERLTVRTHCDETAASAWPVAIIEPLYQLPKTGQRDALIGLDVFFLRLA
jgi:hypothetical protein